MHSCNKKSIFYLIAPDADQEYNCFVVFEQAATEKVSRMGLVYCVY